MISFDYTLVSQGNTKSKVKKQSVLQDAYMKEHCINVLQIFTHIKYFYESEWTKVPCVYCNVHVEVILLYFLFVAIPYFQESFI